MEVREFKARTALERCEPRPRKDRDQKKRQIKRLKNEKGSRTEKEKDAYTGIAKRRQDIRLASKNRGRDE